MVAGGQRCWVRVLDPPSNRGRWLGRLRQQGGAAKQAAPSKRSGSAFAQRLVGGDARSEPGLHFCLTQPTRLDDSCMRNGKSP
jgi:hypothetical protein